MSNKIRNYLYQPINIAPLAMFRVLFGLMMLSSIVRFWSNGWIESLYLEPSYHFSYLGFEWVKPIGEYTYIIFIICGLAALLVALGYQYKIAIITFFLSFTYIELMDKTTYLNHYYFISLMSFILIGLPANRYFSLDVYFHPKKKRKRTAKWHIFVIQLMLGIVYFYAGLAKLNSDWLLKAMPLKIWLPANQNLPIIGSFLTQDWFIYSMAWAGAIYDLAIPFLLWKKKTRWFAYILVIVFHVFTRILFPIGMFPYVMILSTLIFFSEEFHQNIINQLTKLFSTLGFKINSKEAFQDEQPSTYSSSKWTRSLYILFFIIQFGLPFRYLMYDGELFWHEQGFRFSWRVMLMEKAGNTRFIIKNGETKKTVRISPSTYLSPFQEKQMAFQPDFIIEFAHFLSKEFENKGFKNPEVYAESYVALNGRRSKAFVNPKINLAKEKRGFQPIKWLLPFNDSIQGL